MNLRILRDTKKSPFSDKDLPSPMVGVEKAEKSTTHFTLDTLVLDLWGKIKNVHR